MKRPLISVIICTYNRADLLATLLQTLAEQQIDLADYEILVIDNNSTDETSVVCDTFAARYPNVRYYMEPQQGLSHARNRGWQEAQGTYIAYIDDDCKAPATWLTIAKAVIEQVAPDVFGGPYFPFYNSPKPAWFRDEYGSWIFGVEKAGDIWRAVEHAVAVAPGILHGGNLFLRRELPAIAGGFDQTLGMNGHQLAYGEETALLLRLHTIRPTTSFTYEPRLFVYHLVRAEKLSIWWQLQSKIIHGEAAYRIYHVGRQPFPWWMTLLMPMYIAAICYRALFRAWFRRDRTSYPHWQNYLYESAELTKYLHRLGMWWGYVKTGLPYRKQPVEK
jgi:glucosyl-dolichyl phosphate glucuronosyltransferase